MMLYHIFEYMHTVFDELRIGGVGNHRIIANWQPSSVVLGHRHRSDAEELLLHRAGQAEASPPSAA